MASSQNSPSQSSPTPFGFDDVDGNVNLIHGHMTAGGDIIAGNKTVIQNIIQQAARQIVTTPYKFLASYDISDHDIFFGRDAVIEQLVGNFPRFKTLVINGRSGAGKTSLINAGLIPRLADNGYQYISFREYSDPLRQLRDHAAQNEVFRPFADATRSLASFLTTMTRRQQMPLVVIFDQFERFFVNVPAALRTQFIQEIKACLSSDLSGEELDLVFALREDFFGTFLIEFETAIPTFFHDADRFNVLPLRPEEAREAIINPLRRIPHKIGYDKAFVDDILLPGLVGESAGGDVIAPPHVQIVCNQLYQSALERCKAEVEAGDIVQINREIYDDLGGTSGILRHYLDDFVDRASHRDSGGRNVLRSMLKLMVDTTGTRKFVSFADLAQGLPDVVPPVIERHVCACQDGRIIETRGQGEAARYSLSHDVMVAKVAEWFDERELERKKAQETLERGLAEWTSTGALLNQHQVEHIRAWISADGLGDQAVRLLVASQQVYEERRRKDAEQERRIKRNRKAFQMALGIGLIVAVILTGVAFWQRNIAENQKRDAQVQKQEAEKQTAIAQQQRAEAESRRQEAERLSRISLAQSLATQALRQQEQWRQDERAALLARQAYLLNQASQGHAISQLDAALRTVLSVPHFSVILESGNPDKNTMALSLDGHTFAASYSGYLMKVWNLTTPKVPPFILNGHDGKILSIALSPDGRTLASVNSDNIVEVWDLNNPEALPRELRGHTGEIYALAFSPDGHTLVSGGQDTTIRVWDLTSPEAPPRILDRFIGRMYGAVQFIQFDAAGRTFFTINSFKSTIRQWDLADLRTPPRTLKIWEKDAPQIIDRSFAGEGAYILSVALSPDGRTLALGSNDANIYVWDMTTPDIAPRILAGHRSKITALEFSADGCTLASGSWATILLWDLSVPDPTATILRGHGDDVVEVAFTPDGHTLVSMDDDHTIRLWDLQAPAAVPRIFWNNSLSMGIAYSPDGRTIASGGFDGMIRLWNLRMLNAAPRTLNVGTDGSVVTVAFSPDGHTLAAGSRGLIQFWNLSAPDGAPHTLAEVEGSVYSVAFSPDGRFLAAGGTDGSIWLWDLSAPEHAPGELTGHESSVNAVAFSPDGRFLASGSADNTIRLWDLSAPDTSFHIFTGHEDQVTSVAFRPGGRTLASGSVDRTIRLWGLSAPDPAPRILTGHEETVKSVAFSPDGQTLASGSWDGTVRLWTVDAPDLAPITLIGETVDLIYGVAFSPDGRILASGGPGSTIQLWWLTDALADMVCQKVWRNLTWDEWQQFVSPDLPYQRTCPDFPVHPSVLAAAGNSAKVGDFDVARSLYQYVQELDPSVTIDMNAAMNTHRAQGLKEQAEKLLMDGDSSRAALLYHKARTLDPALDLHEYILDLICRYGSLQGMAAEVLDACEQAVTLASKDKSSANWYRKDRGLAYALTGNFTDAIEDFRTVMDYGGSDEESKTRYRQWIDALQRGENPFTPEVLEQLLEE